MSNVMVKQGSEVAGGAEGPLGKSSLRRAGRVYREAPRQAGPGNERAETAASPAFRAPVELRSRVESRLLLLRFSQRLRFRWIDID